MNANVTYFPIQYKSDKSTLSPDSENCYAPQISLPLLRKHIDEMSLQGWALVSIQSIPRIEYRDDHAFSIPSGFMLFWQRDPGFSLDFAPPLATGAVLNEALFAPTPIDHRDPNRARPVSNASANSATSASAPGFALGPPNVLPPASVQPGVFSNSKDSLTDLNQKYRIRSAKSAPGRPSDLGDGSASEQMNSGLKPTPTPDSYKDPVQSMPGTFRQPQPAAASSPDTGGKGVVRGVVAGATRPILDDETTDFDPNDPLVHEIAALRRAMVEQTQTQTHTTQIVHKADLIFDKINRE